MTRWSIAASEGPRSPARCSGRIVSSVTTSQPAAAARAAASRAAAGMVAPVGLWPSGWT